MFIAQAFKFKHDWWRYLIPAMGLALLMLLNFAAVALLDIDVESLMKEEIERKGSNRFFLENLIPFAVLLAGLLFWVKFVHNQTFKSLTTSRKRIDWKRFLFGFMLIAIVSASLIGLDYYTNPENYVFQFQLEPFIYLALITIILLPLQTSFEEYMFRGYLMQGIGVLAKNRWVPLLVTSIVFGLMHSANPEVDKIGPISMVFYIGTGLFLGIITLMDEGLELALGFHFGNNLVASLLVTADWTAFQTNSVLLDISEPSAGIDVILPVIVLYPIFIAIMAFRYKWTGWADKLFGKVLPPVTTEIDAIGENN